MWSSMREVNATAYKNCEDEVRHYCRNDRTKLAAPVTNKREAFCSRGCQEAFYRHHCLICEDPIKQPKRGKRLICNKAKCRSALRINSCLRRYRPSSAAKTISRKPDFIGEQRPLKLHQPWRHVAGPELSASALHCSVVGGAEAMEAVNRTNFKHWRGADAKSGKKTLIKRHHPPVNLRGGYKHSDAPVVGLAQSKPPISKVRAKAPFDDGLDIPEFLRRTARPPEALGAEKSAPPPTGKKTEVGGQAGQSVSRAQLPRRELRGRP